MILSNKGRVQKDKISGEKYTVLNFIEMREKNRSKSLTKKNKWDSYLYNVLNKYINIIHKSLFINNKI